jgi:hypothetical protein
MALLAAASQALAGNTAQAATWAADVHERGPLLTSVDFFRGYPVTAEPMRTKIATALQELGFQVLLLFVSSTPGRALSAKTGEH